MKRTCLFLHCVIQKCYLTLANGNRSDNDLRSCQITKTMLINYIQFVGTNF